MREKESHLCNLLWINCSWIKARDLPNIVVIMLIFKPIIDKTRKSLDITKDGSIVVAYRALLLKNSIYRTLENQERKKKVREKISSKRTCPKQKRMCFKKFICTMVRISSQLKAWMKFRRAISISSRE